ncbi:hypothetical protein J5W78_00425 [Akkermansia massiliensis]|uniref:Uncharacterized protein n=1 Tax=Akkermansia massiliensis TaxID=2927224 RepID=A0ABT0R7W9_9BACT|nr:hypothetical protein [Akkermansia massiliensis]MCL6657017.1 hypothetical protein [Akkermansia massiliensis]MCO8185727.1 hypothetical protein [Akkermansia massiliensis]QWP48785.1 hypothetical protein J5W78_00425 [Akkermansia massiliensis]
MSALLAALSAAIFSMGILISIMAVNRVSGFCITKKNVSVNDIIQNILYNARKKDLQITKNLVLLRAWTP